MNGNNDQYTYVDNHGNSGADAGKAAIVNANVSPRTATTMDAAMFGEEVVPETPVQMQRKAAGAPGKQTVTAAPAPAPAPVSGSSSKRSAAAMDHPAVAKISAKNDEEIRKLSESKQLRVRQLQSMRGMFESTTIATIEALGDGVRSLDNAESEVLCATSAMKKDSHVQLLNTAHGHKSGEAKRAKKKKMAKKRATETATVSLGEDASRTMHAWWTGALVKVGVDKSRAEKIATAVVNASRSGSAPAMAQLKIPDDIVGTLNVGELIHLVSVAQKRNEKSICGWAETAGKCATNQLEQLKEYRGFEVPMAMLYLIDEREQMFTVEEFAADAGETDFAHKWFDAGGSAIFFAKHNALNGAADAYLDASHVLLRDDDTMELVNLGTNV